jgi:RNA polymerase sigma-70 factor (ECF subfamily)
MELYSDDHLLRLMAGNDQAAFTSLYRSYWEPLFVTTVKVIGSKEDAADIVQEVFISLWNRRQELSLTSTLAAYLHASVKYKAIHYIEKDITRRNYLKTLGDVEAASPAPSAEVLLHTKEVRELIQSVINNMPPKMREVYQLSRQEHLSHKEIAARLGISDETVKKHIQHALQLLKTALGQSSISLPAILLTMFW